MKKVVLALILFLSLTVNAGDKQIEDSLFKKHDFGLGLNIQFFPGIKFRYLHTNKKMFTIGVDLDMNSIVAFTNGSIRLIIGKTTETETTFSRSYGIVGLACSIPIMYPVSDGLFLFLKFGGGREWKINKWVGCG